MSIMDVYSADVIKISQGVTNRGKEELARSYSEFLSKYKVHIVVKIEEVRIISRQMAFDRDKFSSRAISKPRGGTLVSRGRLLEVLRKERGKWKSFRVMAPWTSNNTPVGSGAVVRSQKTSPAEVHAGLELDDIPKFSQLYFFIKSSEQVKAAFRLAVSRLTPYSTRC